MIRCGSDYLTGLGTIVNCASIVAGCSIGILLKGGMSKKISDIIMSSVALSVLFIGLGGALSGLLIIEGSKLSTQYTMLTVLSLVFGGILGEAIDIEQKFDKMGLWFEKICPKKYVDEHFVEGFVTASMLFCIGAMAIVGSLEDGLNGNYSILFSKAVLDGISSIIFASSLGFGVGVSAVPLFIYQGGITLLAKFIRPFLTQELIAQMSCVGSVLIFALGVNMLFGKKVKVANLLPAIIIPIAFALLKCVFPSFPI